MKIKKVIKDFFDLKEQTLPSWLPSNIINENATLSSYLWSSDHTQKIRLCELTVKNKFYAESLIIYPNKELLLPIFGTEFLNIADKKYFGAIDFHPIIEDESYLNYLSEFPNTKVNKLTRYDLNKFFSKKFWIKKDNSNFYDEYEIWVKCYLHQYKKLLNSQQIQKSLDSYSFAEYNEYMSHNDPAFGILKSYFNKDFAERYITQFLFC